MFIMYLMFDFRKCQGHSQTKSENQCDSHLSEERPTDLPTKQTLPFYSSMENKYVLTLDESFPLNWTFGLRMAHLL